jgi:hypothetical protein
MYYDNIESLAEEIKAVRQYADQLESMLNQYKEVQREQDKASTLLWDLATHSERPTIH